MYMCRKNSALFSTAAAILAISITVGCGKHSAVGRVPVVPVEGAVVFDGQPTPGAFVVFHPASSTQRDVPPARATVRDDGTFQLTTYEANDGAPLGDYRVTIEWRPLVGHGGDVQAGPNVIPNRYSRPDTTDLQVRVAEDSRRLPPLQIKR